VLLAAFGTAFATSVAAASAFEDFGDSKRDALNELVGFEFLVAVAAIGVLDLVGQLGKSGIDLHPFDFFFEGMVFGFGFAEAFVFEHLLNLAAAFFDFAFDLRDFGVGAARLLVDGVFEFAGGERDFATEGGNGLAVFAATFLKLLNFVAGFALLGVVVNVGDLALQGFVAGLVGELAVDFSPCSAAFAAPASASSKAAFSEEKSAEDAAEEARSGSAEDSRGAAASAGVYVCMVVVVVVFHVMMPTWLWCRDGWLCRGL